MANKPLKSIKFPGLSDTYTVPEVDATLTGTGKAADAKKVGDEVSAIKADLTELEDSVDDVLGIEITYSKNLNKTPYADSATKNGVTFTKNSDGSITMSESPTSGINFPLPDPSEKWLLPAGTYTISGGRNKMGVVILLYANRDDATSTVSKTSSDSATTFTIEQDYWAWVRFSIDSSAATDGITLYPQVEEGSTATEYQSPSYIGYSSTTLDSMSDEIDTLADSVSTLSEDITGYGTDIDEIDSRLDSIAVEKTGKNLVDPSTLVTGFILSDGTISTSESYATYSTTDYIPLEPDLDYVFSCYNSSGNIRDKRVVALLFDESKVPITDSYQNVSTGGYLTFNSGESAKYARVCTVTDSSIFQLESGRTTPSTYEAYQTHVEIEAKLGEIPSAQVDVKVDNAIKSSGIIRYETGKNLVNPETLTTGFIYSNGNISTEGSNANYSTSDFISLEPNTNYVFTCYHSTTRNIRDSQRVVCLLFDDMKTPVSGSYQNVSTGGYLTFNSGESAKYARVCTVTDSSIFQLEKGTISTTCEEYSGKNVLAYPLGETPLTQSQMGNVLYKKKWAVCGDSFTDGATDGVITDDGIYKGAKYVYPYLIGNRNSMEIVKFFNGGQTLAFPAEPGTFTNSLTNPNGVRYYQNIPSDVDYITIYLGINDANHASGTSIDGEETTGEIPIGEIDDETTATYYGAWNVVLAWLITNRPNAHIGIIVTNGNATNDAYRQAQIAISQKYGIPYIDLNGDARTPAMLRTSNPNISSAVKTALIEKWRVSSSNTHPNDAAHLFESKFIEEFLRSI